MNTFKQGFERHKLENDNFLHFFATGDETWVVHYTPETNRQGRYTSEKNHGIRD